ncbi:DUF1064 domain-containing protein [Clostridium botulinum]|uniref:DUF1064 domain-containing protein n=1 Tax=Clostridium botulinum (strain 657 / Type Ba4) TaxID=515621 RepID=A0A3F3ACW8_CLOB6|nr:DUF1064 domain-containing protein [Clostridium botulinum]ACQ53698.1 conserved hypothetical protein [Clostridium botulinum Ba4 str. 657]AXG90511.1 DUF1064 domain-containing protein [Clostridium botulinum]MBY6756984.1 DUF1064 domain-containing protein [Clostridium botulinum]NEZ85871.1 DUF1064 domain-containing protein [Clostridium botulinum]NFE31926.1 DUF1064 domain-containing protein [Clostridium botulinum]
MNRSKYGAKKIVIDGITFDSKDEGRYYLYLKELKAKEKILNFERQPKYELQPSFKKYGKTHRAITYAPDFLIYHLDGSEELIDVKGTETQQGNMRRKMFDYKYPELKLTWVARSLKYSSTGWIEYDELKKIRKGNKKCQK